MPWAPDYTDTGDLEEFSKVEEDPFIGDYGIAASRAVDDTCNRQFGKFDDPVTLEWPVNRAFRFDDGWLLEVDDIQDTTGLVVTVGGATLAAGTGYKLWPADAIAKGKPATALKFTTWPSGTITVAARFGWNAIPRPVVAAARLQVNRWHVRRESPYGVAGSPSEGSETRLSARLDPDVLAILARAKIIRARLPR